MVESKILHKIPIHMPGSFVDRSPANSESGEGMILMLNFAKTPQLLIHDGITGSGLISSTEFLANKCLSRQNTTEPTDG